MISLSGTATGTVAGSGGGPGIDSLASLVAAKGLVLHAPNSLAPGTQDIVPDAAMPTGLRMTAHRNVFAPGDGYHWRPSADFDWATVYPGAGGPGCPVTADGVMAGPGLELPPALLQRVQESGADYSDRSKGGHLGFVHKVRNARTLFLAGEAGNAAALSATGADPIDNHLAVDGQWMTTDVLWVPRVAHDLSIFNSNFGRMTRIARTANGVTSATARRIRVGIDASTGAVEAIGGGGGAGGPMAIAASWFTQGALTPAERKLVMDFLYGNAAFAAIAPIAYRPQGPTCLMNGDSYRQPMGGPAFMAAAPSLQTLMNFAISGTEPSSYILNWPLKEGGMDLSDVPTGKLVYFGGEKQNGGTIAQNQAWMTLVRALRSDVKILFGVDSYWNNNTVWSGVPGDIAEFEAYWLSPAAISDGYIDAVADMWHTAPYDPGNFNGGAPNKSLVYWQDPAVDPAQHPNAHTRDDIWIPTVIGPGIEALLAA
jgi:hypothetical protein